MEQTLILEFSLSYKDINISLKFSFINGFNIILGPSGSGKTTALNVIAGFIKPKNGFLKFKDKILFDKNVFLPPQKRNVGIVFQENNLLPHLTVEKNIVFATKKRGDIEFAKHMIHKFGLSALLSKYPHELSGGQKQRIALIRALSSKPDILLLDEPFSALDYKTKFEIIEFVKSLELGMPVIMVTHNLDEAFYLGKKVFLIENGKNILEGDVDILKDLIKETYSVSFFS